MDAKHGSISLLIGGVSLNQTLMVLGLIHKFLHLVVENHVLAQDHLIVEKHVGELLDSFSSPCFAVVGMHYLKLFASTPSYGGRTVLVGSGSELV